MGKRGRGGQEVGAAVVLCAMELVGFRFDALKKQCYVCHSGCYEV